MLKTLVKCCISFILPTVPPGTEFIRERSWDLIKFWRNVLRDCIFITMNFKLHKKQERAQNLISHKMSSRVGLISFQTTSSAFFLPDVSSFFFLRNFFFRFLRWQLSFLDIQRSHVAHLEQNNLTKKLNQYQNTYPFHYNGQ